MFIIALFLSKTRVFHIFLLFVPYLPKKNINTLYINQIQLKVLIFESQLFLNWCPNSISKIKQQHTTKQ